MYKAKAQKIESDTSREVWGINALGQVWCGDCRTNISALTIDYSIEVLLNQKLDDGRVGKKTNSSINITYSDESAVLNHPHGSLSIQTTRSGGMFGDRFINMATIKKEGNGLIATWNSSGLGIQGEILGAISKEMYRRNTSLREGEIGRKK